MADSAAASTHSGPPGDITKRDLLQLVATAGAAIGVGALAWPFIDSMNPSKDVLALSTVDIDLSPVVAGQGITVVWQGKPGFVRHRTPEEIKQVQDTPLSQMIDPAPEASRVKEGHEQWAILVGICTHLGCVPLGNKPSDPRGDFGGGVCPRPGHHYDTPRRVRHGPAPANLPIPPYAFTSDTKIKIG